MTTTPFQWSDAWLLHAVCAAGGGRSAKLSSVVAAADYINHAILTTSEIRGGVFRLVAAGHLIAKKTNLRPRGAALNLWKEMTTKRRAVHTLQRAFEKLLSVESRSGTPSNDTTPPESWPTEAMVKEACHEYLAMTEIVLGRRAVR
jgi:hypothetical protein